MVLDAEVALIGALLTDEQAIKSCDGLEMNMFRDPLLGMVFREFQRAADFGYTLTLVEIAEKLSGIPPDILVERLRECLDSSISSALAPQYAAAVQRNFRAREADRIIGAVQFSPDCIDRQLGEIVNELESLADKERSTASRIGSVVDILQGEYFRERKEKPLLTGFKRLDEYLGGLERGDIIVIGARPAVGKSALVTQMARHISGQGKRVLLYSLEMPERQLYERLVAQISGISLQRIRRAVDFLGGEKGRFDGANDQLKKLDLWISSGAKSVSQIRAEARHMDADCIIVDYLQLVRSERRYSNRASEVGEISKAFKALALELGCPIILLSQLNRLSEVRDGKEPTMAELRESGDIEQDASVILLLWNCDPKDNSQKGLKVAKNRQGELGKFRIRFSGASMKFEELDNADFSEFHPVTKTPFD